MFFITRLLLTAGIASLVRGHSELTAAIGDSDEVSVGFAIRGDIPRNCTSISPCQQDTTIIRELEILEGTVQECGRTQIDGPIDVKASVEKAIKANAVTTVSAGGKLIVTIHQVNADGGGPYLCDLDQTAGDLKTGQIVLEIADNVPGANGLSTAKTIDFNVTLTMPEELECIGGSTENICVVRCRNNSLAGPFGGCIAVEQAGRGKKGGGEADKKDNAKEDKEKNKGAEDKKNAAKNTKEGGKNNKNQRMIRRWVHRQMLRSDM